MDEVRSVHDNWIYGYVVACEARTILLCTEFGLPNGSLEFTDVLFSGVVAHHFEHVLKANILFDIEPVPLEFIFSQWGRVFEAGWKYGWPIAECNSFEGLARKLRDDNVGAFAISSSFGLNGLVLAQAMTLNARQDRRLFV